MDSNPKQYLLAVNTNANPSCVCVSYKVLKSPSILRHIVTSMLSMPSQTGRSAFRLAPLIASSALAIYGPITGTLLTKPAIVIRKSPNRTSMPYSSIMKPMKAHRIRISDIPATKATVPFHFCLRAKNATVLVVPMMSVRPIRNNIY